jgi:two-component system cell cycle sensor histidine kinase/response regulator CckA
LLPSLQFCLEYNMTSDNNETSRKPATRSLEWLRKFFAAPHYDDEEKGRLARILNTIILFGVLGSIPAAIATAATAQYGKSAAIVATAVVVFLLRVPLRSGRVRLAIFLTFLALLTLVTFLLWTGAGIHDLGSMLYPIIIACAGLLLRPREFLAIVILSMLSAAAIILLEISGTLTISPQTRTTIYTLITVATIFFLAALPVRLMATSLLRSISHARQGAHELAESNTRLQQEISEHRLTEEALRESETRFRILAESTFEGLCITEDGVIIDANSRLALMLGLEPREIIGRKVNDFLEAEMDEIVVQQIRSQSDSPFEHQIRRRDGTLIPVESRSKTIPYGGRMVQVTTCHDLSERRRSEEEHRILEAEIRQSQKLESLGTLAGGIAHDFNNIISIISGHATAISGKLKDHPEAQAALRTISEAAERGGSMVRQILTFARKSETEFRSLQIQDMVTDLVKMLRVTFPRTVEISYSFPQDLPPVWMDPSQLHQALLNLCINARDAMASKGKLEIFTTLTDGDEIAPRFPAAAGKRLVRIQVLDTGVGMDEKTRSRIFEPFFTTKGRGRGTGLGLALVYGVVQAHKGFVEVDSRPGKGTSFSLYFPASERLTLPSATEDTESQPLARGSEMILVVEDEEDLRELLTTVLHDYGYGILVARDGMEALERYHRHSHDISLVITDMDLPKINGAAVSRSILSENPEARIILISGFVETAMKNSILASGVREFVAKPYTMPQMLQTIRKVLDAE